MALQSLFVDGLLDATAQVEERHFWFLGLRRNARALLDRAVNSQPIGLIVDCGSGTGRNLDWLRAYGPSVGVELSPTGVRHARAHQRRVVRGSVTHLPFPDASADIVTSFDVFVCLDDAAERHAVQEMWRVLKPGGVALVNTAALRILYGAHSALSNEYRRYTRPSLAKALTGAGFTIERMTFTNMVTFPILLAMRTFDRVSGRVNRPTTTDLSVPPAPVNLAMHAALRAESALLSLTNLPIGSSILCIARKPAK